MPSPTQLPPPPTPGVVTNPGVALTGPAAPRTASSAAEACPWSDHDTSYAYERLMGAAGGHRDAVMHFLADLAAMGVEDVRKYVTKKTLAKLRDLVEAAEERRAAELAARPRRLGQRPTDGKPLERVTVAYVA